MTSRSKENKETTKRKEITCRSEEARPSKGHRVLHDINFQSLENSPEKSTAYSSKRIKPDPLTHESLSSNSSESTVKAALSVEVDSEEERELINTSGSLDEVSEPDPEDSIKQGIFSKKLEGLAMVQKQRIYLNIGGTKFETSVNTLQSDPSSLLAKMMMQSSPFKPYQVKNVYCYFLDRDPNYFSFILNYLRNNCSITREVIPKDIASISSVFKWKPNFLN